MQNLGANNIGNVEVVYILIFLTISFKGENIPV